MDKDVEKILYDEKSLEKKAAELAELINNDYKGKKLVVVGILKGCIVFLADLFRRIKVDCELDFMAASSCGSSTESSGELIIKKDLSADIRNKDVLIVEDILDTGNTLYRLKDYIRSKNPASVKLCVLFDKPDRRKRNIRADYCGYTIDDLFIVGYGLDYDEKYRNLPYVGVLKPEIYNKSN